MVTADLGLVMTILQVDERSFFFTSEKNPGVVRPAENFTLSECENFKILQLHAEPTRHVGEEEEEVEIELAQYPAWSPAWFPYSNLAIRDPRVRAFLVQRRRPADSKFLALPFIKQFALTDGMN